MNGRMYDPILGRMLSPDPYVVDPNFPQDYNRYSYARNNPLVYVDPDGEFIITAIVVGTIIGAYIGASAANNTLDPTMWNWGSEDTWIGMGIGGVIGAFGGWGFYAAAPALASTSFFAHFGASGVATAYSLTGTVVGGAVGYGAGFGSALYSSSGNLSYANGMAGVMSGVGAQIGSVAGMAAGGWAAYGSKLAEATAKTTTTTTVAKEVGNYTFTKTAAQHLDKRPYMNSPSTIINIIKSGKGVPDATFKGGVNYKVSGTFGNSQGIWELGINHETNTIYHFLFKGAK